MENQAAGAVLLYRNKLELKIWVKSVLQELWPEEHGEKYTQEFIIQELSPELSVCFYVLTGYETQSENLAFEHAFFVLDEFILDLEDAAPDKEYLILVDVRGSFEVGEWLGFETIEAGLDYFNVNLNQLRLLRKNIRQIGEVIWTNKKIA